jgi:diadenosine tetraphosphatase ApaH/serine/threonine PP2A family protein phosphatase
MTTSETPGDLKYLDPSARRHMELDEALQRQRLMVVGDIHGCCDEFRMLLDQYARERDTVILAGDLVNKGPKSAEVVRLARSINALAIVGNHELASLRAHSNRQGGAKPQVEPFFAWTDELTPEDVEYLKKLPFTISLPLHNALVVHAGLVPGIALDEQNPLTMVTMRNLRGKPGVPYEAFESVRHGSPWAPIWQGPEHIYFGHDATRRLQLCPFATGLDTGCLYGGSLTAVILQLGSPPTFVSVKAKATYVMPANRTAAEKFCSFLSLTFCSGEHIYSPQHFLRY